MIKFCLRFVLISVLCFPLVYCASSLDQQAEDNAKEIACANGEKYYLYPLSRSPNYKMCD